MSPFAFRSFLLLLALGFAFSPLTRGQESPAGQEEPDLASVLHLSYPDSANGLEKLAKDILEASKKGDTARATALAKSMVLPHPADWYSQTFGDYSGKHEGSSYEASRKNLANEILGVFTNAQQQGATDVIAKRFEKNCDDEAGENMFGVLESRQEPLPIYELRFRTIDRFFRLSGIAFVDGAFRYFTLPEPPPYLLKQFKRPAATPADPNADSEKKDQEEKATRIRQGGNVIAAKLIQRVQPSYPDQARHEHVQGTVRLHAIIAKDGTIAQLRVLKGYCSLAQASLDAVKKWRYSPTQLLGEPVEVDTTIDVIFTLNR